MKIKIERTYVIKMTSAFPELSKLDEQLKFGNYAEMPFYEMSSDQLSFLHDLYIETGSQFHGKAAYIKTLQKALDFNGKRYQEGELETLVPDITEFLVKDSIRGWLFKANHLGRAIAYLVIRVDFTPPGEEEAGRIIIDLKANSMAKIITATLYIRERDVIGKNLTEIFAEKGYLKETPELINTYDLSNQIYFDWRANYGQQFSARGTGIYAEDPTANHRQRDISQKNIVVLTSGENDARLVNDEEVILDRDISFDASGEILAKYLRKAAKSMNYNEKVESTTESLQQHIPENLFTELPVHAYILMFHMDLHQHLWVHVDDMSVYEYDCQLKEKLILPEEQTDLIDILTAEMDVLMDDIVQGKSGGTTVMCSGPPGVGKTLTAEVYSEIIKRPLYRVHSGQLGLNVTEMELQLKTTLTRAQRWGAVMLIDEADVYIKHRDDNIASNAVVGVFLRVLEYFNGLLFLTTNRVNDIDEAIISRCIALIKYDFPNHDDRYKIWQVMSHQFELKLPELLINELTCLFPQASGRDIKGLTKLVAKYCHHKTLEPSLDVFKRCSIFRGMEIKKASNDR